MRITVSPIKQFLLIIALTAMWSPSFLFIKLALNDFPPLTIVSLRVSLAAVILLGILLWRQRPLPRCGSFWLKASVMAFFSSSLPFFLFCYAEQTIVSALAALLNATTPMFTAIMAHYFVGSDRMNRQKAIGIALCSGGLVLLFAPQLTGEEVSASTIGMLAALGATLSYSLSHVYGKLYTSGHPPFVAPAAQLIASSVMLWPLAIWHDRVWELSTPSAAGLTGILGLALFGTVCAFIIYYKLLDHCGPTAISLVACFFPVIGMLLGFVFLEETLTLSSLMAAAMILLGMMVVNGVLPLKFLKPRSDAAAASTP